MVRAMDTVKHVKEDQDVIFVRTVMVCVRLVNLTKHCNKGNAMVWIEIICLAQTAFVY